MSRIILVFLACLGTVATVVFCLSVAAVAWHFWGTKPYDPKRELAQRMATGECWYPKTDSCYNDPKAGKVCFVDPIPVCKDDKK